MKTKPHTDIYEGKIKIETFYEKQPYENCFKRITIYTKDKVILFSNLYDKRQ